MLSYPLPDRVGACLPGILYALSELFGCCGGADCLPAVSDGGGRELFGGVCPFERPPCPWAASWPEPGRKVDGNGAGPRVS